MKKFLLLLLIPFLGYAGGKVYHNVSRGTPHQGGTSNAVNLKKYLSILDKLCELLKSKEKYLPNKTWSSI
jgi:hypothetical protein